MTAEELSARRRTLLAMRRAERERDEPDAFALFLLGEELGDVNARLRALRGAAKAPKTARGEAALDRAQYLAWQAGEESGARGDCLAALAESAAVLTARQEQMLSLRRAGLGVTEIARRLGVNKSTASRTLARARRRLRRAAERNETERMKRKREGEEA